MFSSHSMLFFASEPLLPLLALSHPGLPQYLLDATCHQKARLSVTPIPGLGTPLRVPIPLWGCKRVGKGLHSPPPGKRSGLHWLSDTQRYLSSLCGETGPQVGEGPWDSLGGAPWHPLPPHSWWTLEGGGRCWDTAPRWHLEPLLTTTPLPATTPPPTFSSMTCFIHPSAILPPSLPPSFPLSLPPSLPHSLHLWAESLHLVFSDNHLGDDDKDRGALRRQMEREKK